MSSGWFQNIQRTPWLSLGLAAIAAAGMIGGVTGCRAPGAGGSIQARAEPSAEVQQAARDAAAEPMNRSSEENVRSAGDETEKGAEVASNSSRNGFSSWSPVRWSGLLGRFGTPKRVPLPRSDLDTSATLNEESAPQSDMDDF